MKLELILPLVVSLVALTVSTVAQEAPRLEIVEVTGDGAPDPANDRLVAGTSHNIFVGKVLQDLGTVALQGMPLPHTRFRVAVVSNIKGHLEGGIFVDTPGGIKGGKLYVMRGIRPDARLKVGQTCLFCTRSNAHNPQRAHLIARQPSDKDVISTDSARTVAELAELSGRSDRVREMREAYRNEIIPAQFRATARNSYHKEDSAK